MIARSYPVLLDHTIWSEHEEIRIPLMPTSFTEWQRKRTVFPHVDDNNKLNWENSTLLLIFRQYVLLITSSRALLWHATVQPVVLETHTLQYTSWCTFVKEMICQNRFQLFLLVCICLVVWSEALSVGGIKSRAFVYNPLSAQNKPKLILISGCPGTGKVPSCETINLHICESVTHNQLNLVACSIFLPLCCRKIYFWNVLGAWSGNIKMHFDRYCACRYALLRAWRY